MKKFQKILPAVAINLAMLAQMGVVFASNDWSVSTELTPIGGLSNSVSTVLGVAQWVGLIAGVVMVIWIGVKYITAGAGGKAEVKSTMIPWLVGAALVALAPTIANAVFSLFAGGNE